MCTASLSLCWLAMLESKLVACWDIYLGYLGLWSRSLTVLGHLCLGSDSGVTLSAVSLLSFRAHLG